MAVQRRTGPSGTSRLSTIRTTTSLPSFGFSFSGGGGSGPTTLPLPLSPLGDPLSGPMSSGNLSAAADILGRLGKFACEQLFNPEICRAAADAFGLTGDAGNPAVPGDPLVGPTSTTGPCPEGTFRFPGTEQCVDILPGGGTSGAGLIVSQGEAVKGRFGAGVRPEVKERTRLRCPRGMVLGRDNICYERLRNDERKWPKGRKPLLTGGELNAITTASRAADRMDRQKKRLEKLGLLKKSTRTKKVFVCPKCRKPRDECVC